MGIDLPAILWNCSTRIEDQLALNPVPRTWPVGDGDCFAGVIDRGSGDFVRFTRTARGSAVAPEEIVAADSASVSLPAGSAAASSALSAPGRPGDTATRSTPTPGSKLERLWSCLMPLFPNSTPSDSRLASCRLCSTGRRSPISECGCCWTP